MANRSMETRGRCTTPSSCLVYRLFRCQRGCFALRLTRACQNSPTAYKAECPLAKTAGGGTGGGEGGTGDPPFPTNLDVRLPGTGGFGYGG